jgi:hypothetical protein
MQRRVQGLFRGLCHIRAGFEGVLFVAATVDRFATHVPRDNQDENARQSG